MPFSSKNSNASNEKNQMLVNANELKTAAGSLNSIFAQLLTIKNDEMRNEILKQINQVISGMTILMKDLNSFKTLLEPPDQKLLDTLSEMYNQFFLNIKYLTLEKSATFENTLNTLHKNVLNYSN